MILTVQSVPAPVYALVNTDIQNEVRLAAQESFLTMHNTLREIYGPLDSASKPMQGQIIPIQVKVENYGDLFGEKEWPQILHDILKKDFIGFLPGSTVDVIPIPGKQPIVYMTCLAFKSNITNGLSKVPIVDGGFTMYASRKKVVCSVSVTERSLSCPVKGMHAGTAQIIHQFIADPLVFAGLTQRCKATLAKILKKGIWKHLHHEEILARFSVRKIPHYFNSIASSENNKKAYVIEVAGFSDGDVNHITACLKIHESITVQCTDRAVDEDSAGDTIYPDATLIFHRSSKEAAKATLE
jgi:hypothetical protein